MAQLGKHITNRVPGEPRDSDFRPKMFCLGCHYVLDWLSVDRCPECGRGFDRSNRRTFGRRRRLPYWVRTRLRALVSGVTAGSLVGILSIIVWSTWSEPWSGLAILLNGPSMLVASGTSEWLAMIILVMGPIISYTTYVITVLSIRKWFVRAAALVVILVVHFSAFIKIMNRIVDAVTATL